MEEYPHAKSEHLVFLPRMPIKRQIWSSTELSQRPLPENVSSLSGNSFHSREFLTTYGLIPTGVIEFTDNWTNIPTIAKKTRCKMGRVQDNYNGPRSPEMSRIQTPVC